MSIPAVSGSFGLPLPPLTSPHRSILINRLESAHDRAAPIISLDMTKVPVGFPQAVWQRQADRYAHFWRWHNGDILNEYKATKKGGKVYKFPLAINFIRNLARKHQSLLFGEVPDTPTPMVKMLARARKPITDAEPVEGAEETPEMKERKRISAICETVLNEVWTQSNGRMLMQEGGTLSQFLGGHCFELCWEPDRINDLEFPVIVKGWPVDFFLPIWKHDDYYHLLEAWIVCKISPQIAQAQYGLKEVGLGDAVYVAHYTETHTSAWVNKIPVVQKRPDGESVTILDIENPFGFVPLYYVPHLREGGFYGNGHVPDVEGLVKEYNARLADMGDIVRDTSRRQWLARNINVGTIGEIPVADGVVAADLGKESPVQKNPPEVWAEDPPQISQGLADLPEDLWRQLLREGNLAPIAFGEDEGSQRSGLTLDIRFWPGTSHARAERTGWIECLLAMNKGILKILQSKALLPIPIDFLRKIDLTIDWYPQIPRDSEQQSNDLILKYQSGLKSLEQAIEEQPEVRDKALEYQRIHKDMEFAAEMEVKATPVKTDQQPPTASTGLKG